MPRDTLNGAALPAAPPETPAPRKPGVWRAMGRGRKTVVVALPLLGAAAGAAHLYGPPPAEWPAAVRSSPGAARPAVKPETPKAEPAQAQQRPPQQAETPAVAAPPGASAQRRPGARTLEGTPPAAVRLAGMAQPAAAEAEAPPAAAPETPAVAPQPQPQRRAAQAPRAAAVPLPEPMDPDAARALAEAAYPEADPLAGLSQALDAARRERAREAAAPPSMRSPRETELAAMMTRLTAMTRELADLQTQDREDFKARLEGVARRLEDLDARLALTEARSGFFALAGGAGAARAAAVAADGNAPAAPAAARQAPERAPAGSPVLGPQSYVVTSASPFLATVAHRNPMPNQPPPPELRVGDTVPGLGKVLGIAQEGTAWVVRTERGPITSGPVAPAGR